MKTIKCADKKHSEHVLVIKLDRMSQDELMHLQGILTYYASSTIVTKENRKKMFEYADAEDDLVEALADLNKNYLYSENKPRWKRVLVAGLRLLM